jgi:hypothetical protein
MRARIPALYQHDDLLGRPTSRRQALLFAHRESIFRRRDSSLQLSFAILASVTAGRSFSMRALSMRLSFAAFWFQINVGVGERSKAMPTPSVYAKLADSFAIKKSRELGFLTRILGRRVRHYRIADRRSDILRCLTSNDVASLERTNACVIRRKICFGIFHVVFM